MAAHTINEYGSDTLLIKIEGVLDIYLRRDLLHMCGQQDVPRRLIIDLNEVTYLDTSGLGLLLLVRTLSEERGCELVLCRCPEKALRLINRTNFHRLFRIEDSLPCD